MAFQQGKQPAGVLAEAKDTGILAVTVLLLGKKVLLPDVQQEVEQTAADAA